VSVRSNLAEELEERLDKLPIVSEFKLWIELKRPDDFVGFARRGMYAFDWQDVHRTVVRETRKYEIVASPLVPIAVTDLPDDIAELARQTKLSDVSLANDKQIDVQDIIDCLTPNAR
jgi:hypothetical protein